MIIEFDFSDGKIIDLATTKFIFSDGLNKTITTNTLFANVRPLSLYRAKRNDNNDNQRKIHVAWPLQCFGANPIIKIIYLWHNSNSAIAKIIKL